MAQKQQNLRLFCYFSKKIKIFKKGVDKSPPHVTIRTKWRFYMEDEFEIVRCGLFGRKRTFRNKRTGVRCKQKFDWAKEVHDGWARVLIDDKFTFFNPNTGKICNQKFDGASEVYDGLAFVKIDGKFTFFYPNTSKLCEQRFDMIDYFYEEWATVEINGKSTFFYPNTGEFCKQKFDWADSVHDGWAPVKINDKYTFFNPNTGKICNQKFDWADKVYDGWARVTFGGKLHLYCPDNGYVFQKSFEAWDDCSVQEALRAFPEDFEHLPTVMFRNSDQIQKCLDATAEGVKGRCSQEGSTKEAEGYAQGIYELISKKIEKEKKNIALEAEAKTNAEKELAEKKRVAEKTAQNIKNLGKNLGGREL